MKRLLVLALIVLMLAVIPTPSVAGGSPYFKGYEDAGFAKAKTDPPSSVLVYAPESDDRWVIEYGVTYWNMAAGWGLFVFTDDIELADVDVTFEEEGTWALWSSEPPYDHVYINIHPGRNFLGWGAGPHELGHALGFRHLKRGVVSARVDHFQMGYDHKVLRSGGYFTRKK